MRGGNGDPEIYSGSLIAGNIMGKGKAKTASQRRLAMGSEAGKMKKYGKETATEKAITDTALRDADLSEAASGEDPEIELTIDSDELSELLNYMDLDDEVDVMDDSPEEDEESRNIQKTLRHSRSLTKKITTSRAKTVEEDMDEAVEESQRPRSRWFITMCRYCGGMFRFRSDQPKPPTCGKPQCVAKFEESSRKLLAAKSKKVGQAKEY